MESKFTPAGQVACNEAPAEVIHQLTVAVVSAVAGNAGLAGMLPRAVAEWSASIIIEYYNVLAEVQATVAKKS
jgi:hypothetical protein